MSDSHLHSIFFYAGFWTLSLEKPQPKEMCWVGTGGSQREIYNGKTSEGGEEGFKFSLS